MTEYHRLSDYVKAHPEECPDGDHLIGCPTCKTRLAPSMFYVASARRKFAATGKTRDTPMGCRDCRKAAASRYPRGIRRREIIAEAKKDGCVDCGLVNLEYPQIFEFDHVRPGKVLPVSGWLNRGTEKDLLDEIARCEVVCANCHRIRTVTRPHAGRGRDLKRRT